MKSWHSLIVSWYCTARVIQGELNTATATEEEVGILMAGGKLEDLKQQQQASETSDKWEVK